MFCIYKKSRVFPDWRKFVDSEDNKQAFFRLEIVKKMPKGCLTVCDSLFSRTYNETACIIYWSGVPSKQSEMSFIWVLPLSTNLQFDFATIPTGWYFGTVPTGWYFLFFILLYKSVNRARAPELLEVPAPLVTHAELLLNFYPSWI